MGVERAVTRWYARRQAALNEIAALEAKLAQMQSGGHDPDSQERVNIEHQLAAAQEKLRALGPCPKPMMG